MAGFRHRRRPDQGGRHALAFYDGRLLLGRIVEDDGRCVATSWPGEKKLGVFRTRREACRAISEAHAAATPVMKGGRNWGGHRQRAVMRCRGTEDVRSNPPLFPLPKSTIASVKPPSKAELRVEAERALLEWQARQRKPE